MLECLYDSRYTIPHHAPPIYIERAGSVCHEGYVCRVPLVGAALSHSDNQWNRPHY